MNKNIRQFKEITDFISNVRFKRSLMGANLKDVRACMEDLNAMYTDALIDQQKAQADIIKTLQERLTDSETQAATAVKEWNMIRDRSEGKDADAATQPEREVDGDIDALVQVLSEMTRKRETIVAQAEREARAVVADAKREAQLLLTDAKAQAANDLKQGKTLLEEVKKLKAHALQVIELTHMDFTELSDQSDMLYERINSLVNKTDGYPGAPYKAHEVPFPA